MASRPLPLSFPFAYSRSSPSRFTSRPFNLAAACLRQTLAFDACGVAGGHAHGYPAACARTRVLFISIRRLAWKPLPVDHNAAAGEFGGVIAVGVLAHLVVVDERSAVPSG